MPSDTNVFCLHGEQTVRTIADTHLALVEHYGATPSITIDPAGVGDTDLTLVQLIESLRRTAERDGKRACVKGPLPDRLRDVLARSGFLNSPDANLFWNAP